MNLNKSICHNAHKIIILFILVAIFFSSCFLDSGKWFKAIETNDQETMASMISDGFDVNSQNKEQLTAIMIAASEGQLELVEFLLEQGAEPLLENTNGDNAWSLANKSNRNAVVVRMLPLLLNAITTGDKETAQSMLSVDFHVDVSTAAGMTALISAAAEGDVETLNILLKKGADITKTLDGKTAWDMAVKNNHLEAATLLLEVIEQSEGPLWVTPPSGLSLRNRPGTEYDKLAIIPFDSEVTLLGRSLQEVNQQGMVGYWVLVDASVNGESLRGWMFDPYLTDILKLASLIQPGLILKSSARYDNINFFSDQQRASGEGRNTGFTVIDQFTFLENNQVEYLKDASYIEVYDGYPYGEFFYQKGNYTIHGDWLEIELSEGFHLEENFWSEILYIEKIPNKLIRLKFDRRSGTFERDEYFQYVDRFDVSREQLLTMAPFEDLKMWPDVDSLSLNPLKITNDEGMYFKIGSYNDGFKEIQDFSEFKAIMEIQKPYEQVLTEEGFLDFVN